MFSVCCFGSSHLKVSFWFITQGQGVAGQGCPQQSWRESAFLTISFHSPKDSSISLCGSPNKVVPVEEGEEALLAMLLDQLRFEVQTAAPAAICQAPGD